MNQRNTLLGIVFILVVLTLACGSSTTAGELAPANNNSNSVGNLNSPVNTEVTSDEKVDEPTSVPPTLEPSPTPEPTSVPVGGRLNPVPIGETFNLILDGDKKFSLTVNEVWRGDSAWTKISSANMFNDEPPSNMEYILVYLTLEYIEGPGEEILELNSYDFDSVSNYQVIGAPSVVDPEPQFDISLFSGGKGEGYLSLLVWKTDPNPVLEIGRDDFFNRDGFFFALTPNYSASTDFSYVETSGEIAVEGMGPRDNPIPVGVSMPLVNDGKIKYTFTVTNIIRGDEAWVKLEDANMFNDEPPEGQEYILVYIVVEYTEGPIDEVLDINNYDLKSISNGQIIDTPFNVDPDPQFDLTLYPGAKSPGWMSVLVYQDDTSPLLGLGVGNSSGSFYFSLVP